MRKRIIVTGGAGFIGSNLCDYLLKNKHEVICIDSFDDYYDPKIKWKNISEALTKPNYRLIEADIKDIDNIQIQLEGKFDAIIHLAAKAGVRYSLKHPVGYQESNVLGTKNILELAVEKNIKQFIFASSSSIYGNTPTPFNEEFKNLQPISPYAQTKLLSEKTGKEFSEKYNLNFISLRFFSVYGPRLRPDLVMNKIATSIYKNKKMKIFGDGNTSRDYTYVNDIIAGIIKALDYTGSKFETFNLGNGKPIKLTEILSIFEEETRKKINIEFVNSINGESDITWANNNKSKTILKFEPKTDIRQGIHNYLEWYKQNLK
ncbi:MAG: NAD-dependent epimerase/dehydratase family protein [Bacteroidales bacterium]|nr:NAD-dependent epimerase/dehydratase family protein [Bacteroidales bacterium]